jgi:cell division protease FtsH
VCLGGITTGAGNDLERATELARRMVCEWGMSDAMGPLTFGKKEEQIFLGREIAQHQDYSEDTAVKIDGEVRLIVQENYARAQALLTANKDALLKIADELLTREVLDGAQVKAIAQGDTLAAAPPKTSATAVVSDQAPAPAAPEAERPAGVVSPPLPDPLPQQR